MIGLPTSINPTSTRLELSDTLNKLTSYGLSRVATAAIRSPISVIAILFRQFSLPAVLLTPFARGYKSISRTGSDGPTLAVILLTPVILLYVPLPVEPPLDDRVAIEPFALICVTVTVTSFAGELPPKLSPLIVILSPEL